MDRNIVETIMGAVVLVVAAIFVVFVFSSSGVSRGGGYEVTAQFEDASGVGPGTDVRMSGVKIGSVLGNELDVQNFLATVTIQIDDAVQLPADSSVKIVPESLLGGNVVVVTPGGAVENLEAGSSFEYTQSAVNLGDLISRFVFSGDN